MELLVRIVDKPRSGKPDVDAARTVAGDVIAAMPDGHHWGREEVRNPHWRILRVPGLRTVEAEALLASELPTTFGDNRRLRKRQMRLDLEAVNAATDNAVAAERSASSRSYDALIPVGVVRQSMHLKERGNAN